MDWSEIKKAHDSASEQLQEFKRRDAFKKTDYLHDVFLQTWDADLEIVRDKQVSDLAPINRTPN